MNTNKPAAPPTDPAAEVVPLVEDEFRVDTREVVTGRVRLRTVTDTAEELVRQELQGTRADVERVPANRVLADGEALPSPRTEGNVVIVPVVEEMLVVEKRLVLKEEVRITLHDTKEIAEVPVTVRKQRAVVERIDMDDAPKATAEPEV